MIEARYSNPERFICICVIVCSNNNYYNIYFTYKIIASSIRHFYFCVNPIAAYSRLESVRNYAAIMADGAMTHLNKKNCSVKSIAAPFGNLYGFPVFRKNFPYKSSINKQ